MPDSATSQPHRGVFSADQLAEHLQDLPQWTASADSRSIVRQIRMKNFLQALAWFDRIAVVAEADNHHPDLHLVGYRHVTVELSTHTLHGVTPQDLAMARKIDAVSLDEKLLSHGRHQL